MVVPPTKRCLSVFKKTLENCEPYVIMSDRELALMNAINMVFSNMKNLLCIWHIEKNVLTNCKNHFAHAKKLNIFMSSWNNVAYSTTTTIFEHNWGEFELFYEMKKVVIEYIKNTWLPWKEKFVSAWTKNYLHFGNRSSSRAEGVNAKLKQYLQVAFNEIKVKLASERIKVLHNGDALVFRELLCHVRLLFEPNILWNHDYSLCSQDKTFRMNNTFIGSYSFILRLNSEDDLHNDEPKEFDELFSELSSRYQM
uniref:MULE transposase domain-containing protein n=1 Tax=Lactuca sativa TaxID=4236 RepID=A0A9R1WK25_LACSA|nr:hypothetical protein LSAT_V11C200087300 [Lactuca sativa]